jgi:hypothetical protein
VGIGPLKAIDKSLDSVIGRIGCRAPIANGRMDDFIPTIGCRTNKPAPVGLAHPDCINPCKLQTVLEA